MRLGGAVAEDPRRQDGPGPTWFAAADLVEVDSDAKDQPAFIAGTRVRAVRFGFEATVLMVEEDEDSGRRLHVVELDSGEIHKRRFPYAELELASQPVPAAARASRRR